MAVPACLFSVRPESCTSTARTKARGRDVATRILVGAGSVVDAVTLEKEVAAGGEYSVVAEEVEEATGAVVVDKKGTAILVD